MTYSCKVTAYYADGFSADIGVDTLKPLSEKQVARMAAKHMRANVACGRKMIYVVDVGGRKFTVTLEGADANQG